jgi:hypothetical protein
VSSLFTVLQQSDKKLRNGLPACLFLHSEMAVYLFAIKREEPLNDKNLKS